MTTNNKVTVGRLGNTHGIHGWLHLFSFTEPADNIFQYPHWQLEIDGQLKPIEVIKHQSHGNHFIVQLHNVDSCDQALLLKNHDIVVMRDALRDLKTGQYYWADLIGLTVKNTQGEILGIIDHLFETGSNDVIVVKPLPHGRGSVARDFEFIIGAATVRERFKEILIPYLPHVIKSVDLEKKMMVVDWE